MAELKVPDIGGHENVDIIAVGVNIGDTIAADDILITLETDKATMDAPAGAAGVVEEVKAKVGDKTFEDGLIVVVEAEGAIAAPRVEAPAAAPVQEALEAVTPVPQATRFGDSVDAEYGVAVLGGGPGGYSAAFATADEDSKVAIVEYYKTLGGVCLNVGCIPSKALLHNAAVIDEVRHLAANGIKYPEPELDTDMLRDYKEGVVSRLTIGLAGMTKGRKVDAIQGDSQFLDPHYLEVPLTTGDVYEQVTPTGEKKIVAFKNCIIAAGSHVTELPFIPEDPRTIDSSGTLALREVPGKLLIIGGGIIGLEMGTVYSTLGPRLNVVKMMDGLMQGVDHDLVKVWQKQNEYCFDNITISAKTAVVELKEDGVYVAFEGANAPKEPQRYDAVSVAAGCAPNGRLISAEEVGVAITDRGFIEVDKQMRTSVPHIYAIGDIVGQPMLAHKVVHESRATAENCAGHKAYFDVRATPGVAYTAPEVARVSETELSAKTSGHKTIKANSPRAASDRVIANGRDTGFTELILDVGTGRIIGGGIVGPNGGDMIGEVCLAIETGCDAEDIGKTTHLHPTLGESIGMTTEVALGTCTDPPAQKKKQCRKQRFELTAA